MLAAETIEKIALTQADVIRLLNDKSPDSRAYVSSKMAYSYSNEALNPKERLIAEQVFRLLLRDTEVRVRASLAENLKESSVVPHDIVFALASDVSEVSLPILEYSQVLDDEDLLDIIHATKETTKYLAISRRAQLTEVVSDSLLSKGNDEVLNSLLANNGAEISDEALSKIVEINKDNKEFLDIITARSRLPISVVEKLVHVVSSNIADDLKKKYKLPDEELQKEVEQNREAETLDLVRDARSHDDVGKLINHLHDSGRLTPSMILSALCQGNFDFFESSLALLSNISVENARKLIADRGDLGFRAIYNKSELPEAMFPAVKLLLGIVRELTANGETAGTSRYANRIVERILQYAEENEVENVSYIIALVRRVAR